MDIKLKLNMGRRIFIIDDDSVAREIELMLENKKMQRRHNCSSLMYDGESNVVPYHTCEERNSSCGVARNVCGWEQPIYGCGGRRVSSYGCGGRRVSSYGCGGGGCGTYPTYGTCG